MPNDYYDFNPSATTWVLMLSGMVLFVVALSLLLIYLVHRAGQATAPARTEAQPQPTSVPAADRTVTARRRVPVAKVS
jgi:flagellar biogenesis protein FliO